MFPATIRLNACVLLLAALVPGHAPPRSQDPEPAITIPRVDRPPELEDFSAASPGDLPGPALRRVTEFVQSEPGDGVAVSQPTTAYLSYDDANLYIVFVCRDDPARVRANVATREDIGEDDQVLVYLDTFRDRKRAYLFAVNPLGVQQDGIRTDGRDEDLSFDAVWTSDGRLTDEGYVVRMAIPFRSLHFPRDSAQTWGIALGRVIRHNNEESYWPHVNKNVKFVAQLGTLQGLAGGALGAGNDLGRPQVVSAWLIGTWLLALVLMIWSLQRLRGR